MSEENITEEKILWDSVLNELSKCLSANNFKTWFSDVILKEINGGVAILICPNAFVGNWIMKNYEKELFSIINKEQNKVRTLKIVVSKKIRKETIEKPTSNASFKLPLEDNYVSKENNLNKKYTFENFVVCHYNNLAHSAAQAVIDNPGSIYNPLFVYGKSGVGKTHLIQAIGNKIKATSPSLKILYISSETFAQDLQDAIRNGTMHSFKEKYRSVDVLIVDDIQFFVGKEKTQEELFHLFNHLHNNNKQIILSADQHISELRGIENRLKSRFSSGMIVDFYPLDPESRMSIVKFKIDKLGMSLKEPCINWLCDNINGGVREIEGVLNTINHVSSLEKTDVDIGMLKNAVKSNSLGSSSLSYKDIVKKVCSFYEVLENDIYSRKRNKEVVEVRQIVMYILRTNNSLSFSDIGKKLGGKDHTTVMHSFVKIEKKLKNDNDFRDEFVKIKNLLEI